MRKKLIFLLISILVTIIGTVGIAIYDYNVYYSPNGKNAAELQTKYKEYVSGELIDVVGDKDYVRQVRDRISLFRTIHSVYFDKEPIYSKTVEYNEQTLFIIDIYKDATVYTPSADVEETNRLRYEIYVYAVNYNLLKEMFMSKDVYPNDKKLVSDSDNPTIVINFYPNANNEDSEGLYTSSAGVSYTFDLANSETIYGSKLDSYSGYTLYDYSSEPKFNSSNEPFRVQYLGFNDYTPTINLNDDNDGDVNNDRSRFNDGAYIKIDSILETKENNYIYKESLLNEKIDSMNFDLKTLNIEDLQSGFDNDVKDIKIDNVKTYQAWITGKYIWWQCLIAFAIIGAIMTGFYFTFTYEEKPKKSGKKHLNN